MVHPIVVARSRDLVKFTSDGYTHLSLGGEETGKGKPVLYA